MEVKELDAQDAPLPEGPQPDIPRLRHRASIQIGEEDDDVLEYEVGSPDPQSEMESEISDPPGPMLVGANFITSRRRNSITETDNRSAQIISIILRHPVSINLMGALTLFDSYLTCADIDARAAERQHGEKQSEWYVPLATSCLVAYTLEFIMWVIVKHWQVFIDRFFLMDFFIIITGYAEMIFAGFDASFIWLRLFRIVRILRLLKVFRKMAYLKELRKLVDMTSTCMKTLAWSFIFCFVVLTIWAMLMVEFVHELILELDSAGKFADCEFCEVAASSVMHANLLLFKTVIAGDSWGRIAVPVIQEYPATAVIFVGSLLTIVFGVLQLIVAVVVDTFAEKRERDVMNRAEEMEADIEEDKKTLQKIFDAIDEDGSGELSFDELIQGAENDPEFQSRLRVMDIDKNDLKQLFAMIDVKGTGLIDPDEFIQPLSRWVHESKTANRFVKYNVMRSMHQNDELQRYTTARFDHLTSQIQRIAASLGLPIDEQKPRRTSRRGKSKKTGSQHSSFENEEAPKRKDTQDNKRGSSSSSNLARSASRSLERSASRSFERSASKTFERTMSDGTQTSSMSVKHLKEPVKSIVKRLSTMETQQRLILEQLAVMEVTHMANAANHQVPSRWPEPGVNSLSLSSVASNHSGGLPGGTLARPASEVTPPSQQTSQNTPPFYRGSAGHSGSLPMSLSDVPEKEEHENPAAPEGISSAALGSVLSRENLRLLDEHETGARHVDVALQNAMKVVEDVLQSAATKACMKAEEALRMRLRNLLPGTPDDAASPQVDLPDSRGRLVGVRQKSIREVPSNAGLRPAAPPNPRQLRLGEDQPLNPSERL